MTSSLPDWVQTLRRIAEEARKELEKQATDAGPTVAARPRGTGS